MTGASNAPQGRQGNGRASSPASPVSPGSPASPSGGRRRRAHGATPAELNTWLRAVEKDWKLLQNSPASVRGDPGIVLKAMEQNWQAIKIANQALKEDRAFVLEAMRRSGLALQVCSEELRSDREVVLAAISNCGMALRFAFPYAFRDDRDMVLSAVRQDFRALGCASDRLKADQDLVIEALQQDWRAIEFTDEVLRDNREVMLAAVRSGSEALRYATTRIRQDPDFLAEARDGGLIVIPESDARIVPGLEGHIGDLKIARRMMSEPFQFKPEPLAPSCMAHPTPAEAAATRSAEWVAAAQADFHTSRAARLKTQQDQEEAEAAVEEHAPAADTHAG